MSPGSIAMRVHEEGGPLVADAVPVDPPPPGWVQVDVAACGVCGADIRVAAASGATLPVTPGHEIAGTIAQVGDGVQGWAVGDRVAVGWFGGSCGHCDACRRGDVVHCAERMIPGQSYPGGWAQSVTVPADALIHIPDGMDPFDAAPMGCAGVTVFNALRQANLPAGGRVAVFGLGGLGHLAVQFAVAMGHDVVAVARGADREALAHQLGATDYIDSAATAPGAALAERGGVDLILSTASTTAPVAELLTGLRTGGRLTMLGVDSGTVEVPASLLVMKSLVLTGHLTGGPRDVEDAMRFALQHGVRPVVERMPLDRAGAAVQRLAAGDVRCRVVLDPGVRS